MAKKKRANAYYAPEKPVRPKSGLEIIGERIPRIAVGDEVSVHLRTGGLAKTATFSGKVTARSGSGPKETITVKISASVAMSFVLNSGDIAKVVVERRRAGAKRKSRAKSTEPARKMLFWGVYNQSLKRVAKYDFMQKKEAEAKAAELSTGRKSQHFVQKITETK